MSQDVSFTASTTHINHLAEIFQSVSSISSQGLVIINSKGIILYCENNHILNCQAVIDTSLFNSFNLTFQDQATSTQDLIGERSLRFGIDFSLINYGFDSLSNNTKNEITCYLSYNGDGTPFIVEFEDNIMSESIEFLTYYSDLIYPYGDSDTEEPSSDLIVDYTQLEYEMILKSSLFTNLLQDLLNINTETLYIYISNYFSTELNFISKGPIGLSKLIYPNERNNLEKLEMYSSSKKTLTCFKFQNFIKILRGVKLSHRCKIIKDFNGVFSLQLICKTSNNNNYAGTLITINITENENDELTVDNIQNVFEVGNVREIVTKKPKLSDDSVSRSITQMEVPLFL